MSTGKFVPALGYDFLTPYSVRIVALTTREAAFKKALVQQASIERIIASWIWPVVLEL